MNKAEFVNEIATKTNKTKKEAEELVEAVFGTIVDKVSEGEKIAIAGFGSFEKKHKAARVGHNPKTGESLNINEKDVPAFKASSAFKESVK